MSDDEIKELALQAGFFPELNWDNTEWHAAGHNDVFERFARLVAAKERETCALLCDDIAMTHDVDGYPSGAAIADECAAAIRGESK